MELSLTLAGTLVALGLPTAAAGLVSWMRPDARALGSAARVLSWVCLALATAAWLARWRSAGHLPLFGTYESALSLALAVLAAAMGTAFRAPGAAAPLPVACAVAAALVAHGLGFDTTAYPLTISERSWVVDVHALLAWGAFGSLTANAGFALRRLLLSGDAAGADRAVDRTLSLGFLLHSAMMASGSFYKFLLFGRAWSFDPIETLGFVAWAAYGTLLHMRLLAGWAGRRLARWCLGLFVILLITYRGIVYFPSWSTYHIFDMDLRMHLTGAETSAEGGSR